MIIFISRYIQEDTRVNGINVLTATQILRIIFPYSHVLTVMSITKTDMDDEHEDVGGYVYESNACFSCHPDGEDKSIRPRVKELR
jgi:hypothetical protein